MTKDHPPHLSGRSMFALGCAWSALIAIVVLVLAFLWVLWQIGYLGHTN